MISFTKGSRVKTLDELMRTDFILQMHFTAHGWRLTLVPFGWFQNWQLHYALVQISTNRLYHVKRMEAAK